MSPNSQRANRLATSKLSIAVVLIATATALTPILTAASEDAALGGARAPVPGGQPSGEAGTHEQTAAGLLGFIDHNAIVVLRGAGPDVRLTVDGSTNVQLDGRGVSVSALREGQEVHAKYEETNGVARATGIEAQTESGQPVRSMSPNDPEWNEVHQGG